MLVQGRGERWTAIALVGLLILGGAWVIYLSFRPDWQAHAVVAISGESDGTILEVVVAHAQCGGGDPRVHLDESNPETVRVEANYDVSGDCDDIGLETLVRAELEAPLGARTIQADSLGRPLACTLDGQPSEVCG